MNKSSIKCNFGTPLESNIPANYIVVGTTEWINNQFEDFLSSNQKQYIYDVSDLYPIRTWWRTTSIKGADTETTGPSHRDKYYAMNPLNPDTRMVLSQFGDGKIIYIIEPDLLPEFKDLLEDENQLYIFHNAVYDYKWLFTKYKIDIPNIHCSMLAEQVLTCGRSGYRVSLQASVRRHPPYYLMDKTVRSLFNDFSGRLTQEMVDYAARDITPLFALRDSQAAMLYKYKLMETAKLEFDIINCTAELELDGITPDIEKLKVIVDYWKQIQIELEQEILCVYDTEIKKVGKGSSFLFGGIKNAIDLSSTKDKLEALQALGFDDIEDIKRETLKGIDNKFAQLLAEYSGITKRTTTYGQNLVDRINEYTKKLHPSFNQLGSGDLEVKRGGSKDNIATGRYSSDFQQFMKAEDVFAILQDQIKIDYLMSKYGDKIHAQ